MSKFSKIIISIVTVCTIFVITYFNDKRMKENINLRGLATVDGSKGLEIHNKYRKMHHVGPLKLNKDLTTIAQKYAEHLAAKNLFEHSHGKCNGKSMGENLYYSWHSNVAKCDDSSIVDATKSWYNEVLKYDFNKAKFTKETGHFTQVVWKNTKQVGFGVASSKDKKKCYVVANYLPAGNVIGSFKQNVLKK